jgi:hypothetical protein
VFRFRTVVIERLNQLLCITEAIYKETLSMATTQAQLDTQIDVVSAKLTALEVKGAKFSADVTAALADLKAANPGIDLTPQFNKLVTLATSLDTDSTAADTADAAVIAADPGPAPVDSVPVAS